MSEPKFTPGPWMVGKSIYQGKARVDAEKGGRIADVFAYEEDQVHANAVLIADAPEMYRELKRHCTLCQLRHPECENCKDCPTQAVLNRVGMKNKE